MFGIKLDSELIIYLTDRDYLAENKLEAYCKKHPEYWVNKKVCEQDETIDQYELCKDGPNVPFVDLTISIMDEMVVDIFISNNEIFDKFIIQSEELTVEEAVDKYKDKHESTIYCTGLKETVSRESMKDKCKWARDKGCSDYCPEGEKQVDVLKFKDDGVIVGIRDATYFRVKDRNLEFTSIYLDY